MRPRLLLLVPRARRDVAVADGGDRREGPVERRDVERDRLVAPERVQPVRLRDGGITVRVRVRVRVSVRVRLTHTLTLTLTLSLTLSLSLSLSRSRSLSLACATGEYLGCLSSSSAQSSTSVQYSSVPSHEVIVSLCTSLAWIVQKHAIQWPSSSTPSRLCVIASKW